MRSQASVEIDRPIDEVFQLTNDHVAEWSITVVGDEMIEEKPERIGSTFRVITEERGKRMDFEGVVKQYDRPNYSAVHLSGKMFDIDVEYHFEEEKPGRTRVSQTSFVHGKGLFKVVLPVMGWLMSKASCDAAQKEMDSLKRFCESRQPSNA